jgi:hypothetical protein
MLADTLHRHQQFWSRQIADGPLHPGDLPVEAFLMDCDALAQAHAGLDDYPYAAEVDAVRTVFAQHIREIADIQAKRGAE